jgi:esterase/lipase superfamily enzyme
MLGVADAGQPRLGGTMKSPASFRCLHFSWLIVWLGAGLLAGTAGPAHAQNRITLICTVADEQGRPVPGAEVFLRGPGNLPMAQGMSDASGQFRWARTGLAEGEYQLRAEHPEAGIATLSFRLKLTPSPVVEVPARGGAVLLDATGGATLRFQLQLFRPVAAMAMTMAAAPRLNYATVRVYYATDRRPTGEIKAAEFYGSERATGDTLALGVCEVSIPRDHEMGKLEEPSILKLEFREDPEKHVVLLSVTPQTRSVFYQGLAERVGRSQKKSAFVFVHGYNVTFEDAARRTAQLAYDLGFDGAPVLYSWPSKGNPLGYFADESTVDWTVPHLKQFLEDLVANSGAQTIHLVAHSMGNRPLTNALRTMATEQRTTPLPRFQQVILTAPDVDAAVFRQLATAIKKTADRVTLYASSRDTAIIASKLAHDFPRAGESGENIIIIPEVDTVDVSQVDSELIGHFYYGSNRSVISDIVRLFRDGAEPSRRCGLTAARLGQALYWAFSPAMVCPIN